jgi:hypothetical protein
MSKKAMTKVAWSIDQVRQVLDAKQHDKVDGMLLDTFSASALVQIYDALSPENKAKLEAMTLDRAMDIVWKLMSKTSSRDTEQYVVRGGDSGSYDVLSGPYDSQDEAVNVSAMNDGSSTMSGTQLDSSSIGHDYRFGSTHTATDWDQADFDANAAFWSGRVDAERAKEQRRQELYGWKGQEVVVVGGRKIPKGTRGICFYSGAGQYGWRIGFKDASGQEYWTDLNNVELASEHTGSRRTAQDYTSLAVRGVDGYEYDWGYEYDGEHARIEGEPAVIVFLYDRDGEVVDSIGGVTLSSLDVSDHGNVNLSQADEKYLYGLASDMASNAHVGSRVASAPEGVYNDDGEPLGFDYPSDPGEDDSNDEDEWYDDYAHEAKVERHAISDEFDLRPLHSRVATAFLKKG